MTTRSLTLALERVLVAALFLAAPRLAHTSALDGSWLPMPPLSPRYAHATAIDEAHARLVTFGGTSNANLASAALDQVWLYDLANPFAWVPATPLGTPPPARYWHTMTYDPVRQRMLVFGGTNAGGLLNDLWELSLANNLTWTHLSPAGTPPPARYGHGAVYDSVNDRLVIFGGGGAGGTLLNDVWTLSLSSLTWAAMTPAGTPPSGRRSASLVYDSAQQRLLLFGGLGTGFVNDTWALSIAGPPQWTPLATAGAPPSARGFHGATYDAVHHTMNLYGGFAGSYLSDAYVLTLDGTPTWSVSAASGAGPVARGFDCVLRDEARGRDLVLGGFNGVPLGDLWFFDNAAAEWTPSTVSSVSEPSPRTQATVAYDSNRDRLILFSGWNGTACLNDVYALSLAPGGTWSTIVTQGTPPPARCSATAVYDPVGDRLIVYAGFANTPARFGDVWQLSLAGTPTWTELSPVGGPPSRRANHTAMYDPVRERMVVFGGLGESGAVLNDTWALDLSGSPRWISLANFGFVSPRYGHAAAFDPAHDQFVVCGGSVPDESILFDFHGPDQWSTLAPGPPPRTGASMVYDSARNRFLLFGGYTGGPGSVHLSDVWALAGAPSFSWTQLTPDGSIPAREFASSIYDAGGDRMVVIGGSNSSTGAFFGDVQALQFGAVAGVGPGARQPGVALAPAAPNPARHDVTLAFTLPQAGPARVRVYDVGGRLVRTLADRIFAAGPNTLLWDRRNDAGERARPGLYFYELRAGGTNLARRVVVEE